MKTAARLFVAAMCSTFIFAFAHAQVPSILNYQGRVTVGGTNFNGTGEFKFALVNSNGSTFYWRNDGGTGASEPANAVALPVTQGLYSTLLGDISVSNMAVIPATVFSNSNVNLRVWFRPGPASPFVQLAPDQRIGAAVYALRAAAVDSSSITNISGNLSVSGSITASNNLQTPYIYLGAIGGSQPVMITTFTESATTTVSIPSSLSLNDSLNVGYGLITSGFNRPLQFSPGAGPLGLADMPAFTIGLLSTNGDSVGRNIIAGYHANAVADNSVGSTIAGGGGVVTGVTNANRIAADFSVIGGGLGNIVDAGASNTVIAGGYQNAVGQDALGATIGGGSFNYVESGENATIAGGSFNKVRGIGATVPGGSVNEAFGDDTFAAGVQAKATNVGSFVWSGTYGTDTVSTNDYSFTVRATGGVRFITTPVDSATVTSGPYNGVSFTNGVYLAPNSGAWASLSDSNAKTKITAIKPREILARLSSIPVTEWEYKADPERRYIGPMAQDFHAAFGLGYDDKTISTLDADGVALAAIQGLIEELKERDKIIQELKTKLETVEERLDSLPPAP